ncbi:MAG TPA: nucleoside deaminase [Candidatus Binatia bacterium]|jgi:tRNA(Arg) A34 adenosine deaminase TadA|nr:nucleoside deaminase [Candidatus Binatia bacterium]
MRIAKKKLEGLFRLTFAEARKGVRLGHGGPFGAAVIDKKGNVLSVAHNTVLRDSDPSCHAEVNAIRAAAKKSRRPHLEGCIVIASSEPCPMCLTTSYWANVAGIVYAVPKEVAASVGFDDSFIYEELEKPPSRRRIPVEHDESLVAEGEAVFREWKARDGKLY